LPESPPQRAWNTLAEVKVLDEVAGRVPVVQNVPVFFRGRWRCAYRWALEELVKATRAANRSEAEEKARWKLLLLLPRMLLRRSELTGEAGKQDFAQRYQRFLRGEWNTLLDDARAASQLRNSSRGTAPSEDRKLKQACWLVEQGELSRARQVLRDRVSAGPRNCSNLGSLD
jgi:hypothetical protein